MDLINVYVKNVGMHLPEKNREDIEREIRSLIEDALEDESQAQGQAPDEAMIVEVLTRMGSPEKVAGNYLPPRYLIGPQLYPHFITTLRIALPIVVILAAIGLGVSLGGSVQVPGDWVKVITQASIELFTSLFHVVGIVVVVFAIIQRLNPDLKLGEKTWDPRKLRLEPDPERVKPAEPIAQIIANVLAIVVFAMYPEWIGFSTFRDGQWLHSPVLASAFSQYLPWLALLWVFEVVENALLLARGRYTLRTRWSSVGLSLGTIVLTAFMLTGPSIVTLNPETFSRLGWGTFDAETLQRAGEAFATSIRLVLGIVLALQVVELGKQLYKLLLQGRSLAVTV